MHIVFANIKKIYVLWRGWVRCRRTFMKWKDWNLMQTMQQPVLLASLNTKQNPDTRSKRSTDSPNDFDWATNSTTRYTHVDKDLLHWLRDSRHASIHWLIQMPIDSACVCVRTQYGHFTLVEKSSKTTVRHNFCRRFQLLLTVSAICSVRFIKKIITKIHGF